MATNTSQLFSHKKSLVKSRKQWEKGIGSGLTELELEEKAQREKRERDKKAIRAKLPPDIEVLARKHHIDPFVYGNDTVDLVLYLEEERKAFEERSLLIDSGKIEAPTRSFGFKDIRPLEDKWKVSSLGGDGRFGEVAVKSANQEHDFRYQELSLEFKAFYDCSVRDTLEQSHFDGYHSRSSFAPTIVVGSAADDESVASLESKAIPPVLPVYFLDAIKAIPGAQDKLYDVALEEARTRYGKAPKKKMSPYENPYEYSKYSKGGTYLKEFDRASLNSDIDKALEKLKDSQSKAMMVEGYDPELVQKLGGDEAVDHLSQSFVNYSVKIRGKAARKGAFFDFSADLVEACNRFNLTKVIILFFKGDGDPNTMLNDAEPLFTHLVVKALSMDAISNSINISDESDTGDRLKLQKILAEFVKYEVKIDMYRANGLTALHTAAQAGNAKMLKFLLNGGADPKILSRREQMSPLMFACKFGHINVMSELIRVLGKSCLFDIDPNGFTPLHFCATSGQTRACMFLLDIGCDKRALDHKLRTAAKVAQDSNYMATSQAISCHAYGHAKGQVYLTFIDEQLEANQRKKIEVANNGNFAQMLWNAADNLRKQVISGFQNMFSSTHNKNEPKKKSNNGGLVYQVAAFVVRMFTPLPPPKRQSAKVVPISNTDGAPASHKNSATNDEVRPFEE